MKALDSNWYKSIWNLNIKEQSWVQDTENQVDFIVSTLGLTGRSVFLILHVDLEGTHFPLQGVAIKLREWI